MTFASRLWDRYGRLGIDDIPDDARIGAGQSALDWFGCAYAGSEQPLARILREEYGTDSGVCTLIGTTARAAIPQLAAMVNGGTGHALDYDDTNNIGGFHPSAPILPAALAIAEADGRSGADLLTALVVGVEIGSRYGAAMGREHYDKGWHTTSTMGVFGATAAVAWLLELDDEQFGYAMGLAASQSAGVRANFATMVKPYHAGFAAERGVASARLGRRGYVSNPDAFDGNSGLISAAGTGEVHQEYLDSVDDEWIITKTLFKYHAACHGTHSAIESARELLRDVAPADVRNVLVTVHPNMTGICNIVHPASGLEAKFSLRAATAMAMLGDDTADPDTFNDVRVHDSDLQATMGRIDVVSDSSVAPTAAIVRFDTATGSREARFDIGIPAADLALQERRLLTKFGLLATPVIGDRVETLAEQLLDLRAVPRVTDLFG